MGKSSRKDGLKWTEELDNTFIDAMLEQQSTGFRVDGTFITAAYKNMLTIIKEKLGLDLTKDNLKNRIKTLKSNFNTCHGLFKSLSGFSWNSETKLFEAEACLWEELIKVYPTMRKWRTTPIYNYDKLAELFAKDRARGNIAATCDDVQDMWNNKDEEDNIQHIEDMVTPINFGESTPIDEGTPPTTKAMIDETSTTKSAKRKRKESADDDIGLQMFKCIQEISQFIVQSSNESRREKEERWEREERREQERREREEKREQERREREERMKWERKEREERRERESLVSQVNQLLFQELQKIGVPEDRIVDAYVALASDKQKAGIVLGAPSHLRMHVLNKVLNQM